MPVRKTMYRNIGNHPIHYTILSKQGVDLHRVLDVRACVTLEHSEMTHFTRGQFDPVNQPIQVICLPPEIEQKPSGYVPTPAPKSPELKEEGLFKQDLYTGGATLIQEPKPVPAAVPPVEVISEPTIPESPPEEIVSAEPAPQEPPMQEEKAPEIVQSNSEGPTPTRVKRTRKQKSPA